MFDDHLYVPSPSVSYCCITSCLYRVPADHVCAGNDDAPSAPAPTAPAAAAAPSVPVAGAGPGPPGWGLDKLLRQQLAALCREGMWAALEEAFAVGAAVCAMRLFALSARCHCWLLSCQPTSPHTSHHCTSYYFHFIASHRIVQVMDGHTSEVEAAVAAFRATLEPVFKVTDNPPTHVLTHTGVLWTSSSDTPLLPRHSLSLSLSRTFVTTAPRAVCSYRRRLTAYPKPCARRPRRSACWASTPCTGRPRPCPHQRCYQRQGQGTD